MRERLSTAQARRIALAAQGFADPKPPATLDRRQLKRVLGRTSLFQIDSVNVAVRAHYMPLFSRTGPYPRSLLDEAALRRSRLLFEYWAHEASLLPVEFYPLFRWRMERAAQGEGIWKGVAAFMREKRDLVEAAYRQVEKHGPMAASDMEGEKGNGGWWGWSDAKRALECLFWSGRVTTAARKNTFERLYDLPERVLPQRILDLPVPSVEDAHRELIRVAARSLGVATASDLRDYFRTSPADSDPRIAELVEAGELLPVRVEGWNSKAYLHPSARLPRRITARALLAPFDPLIWERSRTQRLFDFHYRIGIYTPADKRVHGYYVFPFLLNEALVARVDLKADRQAGALRVLASHAEPGAPGETAEALLGELEDMARWLDLTRLDIIERGDLASRLIACAGGAIREL